MSKKDALSPQQLLERLKIELAVRQDNNLVASGIGGNVSELFFLLSKKVLPQYSDSEFEIHETSNGIMFLTNGSADIKVVRKKLTEFINSHPDKNDYTIEQITNTSFLRDQMVDTLDIKLLIKAIEKAKVVVSWLDPKMEIQKAIRESFAKENAELDKTYLTEMDLPLDFLGKDDEEGIDDRAFVREAVQNHPILGAKYKAQQARLLNMERNLISQEDLDRLNIIGSCPSYIALLVMRTMIGLERLVNLSLDEYLDFLSSINKKIK